MGGGMVRVLRPTLRICPERWPMTTFPAGGAVLPLLFRKELLARRFERLHQHLARLRRQTTADHAMQLSSMWVETWLEASRSSSSLASTERSIFRHARTTCSMCAAVPAGFVWNVSESG